MPKPPLPEHLAEVLRNPNPAVLGSVTPDEKPNTVATWYLWRGLDTAPDPNKDMEAAETTDA